MIGFAKPICERMPLILRNETTEIRSQAEATQLLEDYNHLKYQMASVKGCAEVLGSLTDPAHQSVSQSACPALQDYYKKRDNPTTLDYLPHKLARTPRSMLVFAAA